MSPLTALLRRWKLGVALGLVGLLVGAGFGYLRSPSYVAEARLAVGSPSLEARTVAGYSQASQQLAADIARYVNDEQSKDALREVLGGASSTVQEVAASPVPESSVIRIEVTGTDSSVARTAATNVAQSLADRVNGVTSTRPTDLLNQYTSLSQQTSQLQTEVANAQRDVDALSSSSRTPATDLTAAQQRLADARSRLSVLDVQQTAVGQQYQDSLTRDLPASGLQLVAPGAITTDSRQTGALRYGVAGLVAGLALALVCATSAERRRRRHEEPGEVSVRRETAESRPVTVTSSSADDRF